MANDWLTTLLRQWRKENERFAPLPPLPLPRGWWLDEADGEPFELLAGMLTHERELWDAVQRGEVTVSYVSVMGQIGLTECDAVGSEPPMYLAAYAGRLSRHECRFITTEGKVIAIRWSERLIVTPLEAQNND